MSDLFDPTDIPKELKDRPQWICWASEERNGKQTKTPRKPDGSGYAKANDMATWGSFEEACETAERKGWGIGFVFSSADPYVGIDLDNCLRDDEGPQNWLPSLECFANETYWEISPSGGGLHIIAKDKSIPSWWKNQDRDTENGHEGVEVYEDGRYFTVTGYAPMDVSTDFVGSNFDLEEWLESAWLEFNDTLPHETNQGGAIGPQGTSSGTREEIDLDVMDVLSAGFTEGERTEHPVHGSDTGENFQVDEGRETWRCWRHDTTGNALHIIGMEAGIIDCGQWDGSGLSSETWTEIFDYARENGYDVPEKKGGKPTPDAVKEAKEAQEDAEDDTSPEAESDGGVDVETGSTATGGATTPDGTKDLQDAINHLLIVFEEGDDMTLQTFMHRVALEFCHYDSFVHPPEDARGWRTTLYRFDHEKGIYVPDGERYISEKAQRLLGDVLNNQQTNELVGRITRLSGVDKEDLELEPNRLVVRNGVLDLHTGELSDHDPAEYHRVRVDVEYDPTAECDKIDEFLHDIVEPHDVSTMYQLAAHALYKEYAAEKAAMLVGDGQNGKSVFLDVLEQFVGAENMSHRSLQDLDGERFAANGLEGKLANVHPDMGDEKVHDLGTFKKLTGRDTMTADVKYEKPITFENFATLLFAANRMPAMDEDTHALWRRWIMVNFPNTFRPEDPETVPKRVLMRDLCTDEQFSGLLNRCVEEIGEWWEGRDWFTNVPDPEQVREKMKRASEPIYDFASVCLEIDEESFVEKDTVRACYRQYAKDEGLPTQSENVFGERITNMKDFPIESGQRRVEGGRPRVYEGVRLSSRGRQVLGMDEPDDEDQRGLDDGGPEGRADTMLEIIRELESEDSGASEPMALGKAMNYMSQDAAERAIEKLRSQGDIYEVDGGDLRAV